MTPAIQALVLAAALSHNVDPGSAEFWVNCESSGNAAAVNGPYVGLLQLGPAKRADLVQRWAPQQGLVGYPLDPAQSVNYSLDLVVSQGWHDFPTCGRWLRRADGTPLPRMTEGGFK